MAQPKQIPKRTPSPTALPAPSLRPLPRAPLPPAPGRPPRYQLTPAEQKVRQRHARLVLTLSLLSAIILISLSGFIALQASHMLLGSPTAFAFPAQSGNHSNTPVKRPTMLIPYLPLTVAVGATQSYQSLAITLNDLRVTTGNTVIQAPGGNSIIIIHVKLFNIDPFASIPYSGSDFALTLGDGILHQQDFAALTSPLGSGMIPPRQQIEGDIAYYIPTNMISSPVDPQIVYLPSIHGNSPVNWVVVFNP